MTSSVAAAPQTRALASNARYSHVAIALHWTLAFLILLQIVLGWWMNEWVPDHSPTQKAIEGVHISVGLTVLLLVVVRIVWRLMHRPPPLPPGIAGWERALAGAGHALFYVLMLALPLTGWAMVSLHAGGHISFWGLPWPQMPGMAELGGANPRPLRGQLQLVHTNLLIWVILANLVLHIAGALKHQFDHHPVFQRMWPAARRRA
jgi:cytochrome b561